MTSTISKNPSTLEILEPFTSSFGSSLCFRVVFNVLYMFLEKKKPLSSNAHSYSFIDSFISLELKPHKLGSISGKPTHQVLKYIGQPKVQHWSLEKRTLRTDIRPFIFCNYMTTACNFPISISWSPSFITTSSPLALPLKSPPIPHFLLRKLWNDVSARTMSGKIP